MRFGAWRVDSEIRLNDASRRKAGEGRDRLARSAPGRKAFAVRPWPDGRLSAGRASNHEAPSTSRANVAVVLAAEETTGLDVATAIVAGYAALVATLALSFQVFQWLRTWQTRVVVDLRPMQMAQAGQAGEPVVLLELLNHSGHRVKVTHVGLTPVKRGGMHMWIPHPLGLPVPGPFEIPPRDSVTVYVKPEVIAESDHDPNWKTRAQITTTDRRTFRSKRVRLRELLR